MKINHIGIAVKSIDHAVSLFKTLGFVTEGECYSDSSRKICVQYMINDDVKIELVSPLNKDTPSPVDRYIGAGKTYAMYHVCYETVNIIQAMSELKNQGYFPMEQPTQSVAMNDLKAAYMFHKDMGLVELVEKG